MNILDYDTVRLDDEKKEIVIIDQTRLPGEIEIISLHTAKEIWDAIYLLQVRGAPAIGVTAGFGMYILACQIADALSLNGKDLICEFYKEFEEKREYLNSSRPTAVNLSWALGRMDRVCRENLGITANDSDPAYKVDLNSDLDAEKRISKTLAALHDEAEAIQQEDIDTCRKIGEYGLSLLKPGDGLLTHCNAGQLATSKYGTATAPMYLGFERGYNFRIFCDETRPLLQGARLTSFELQSAGMDVTLICDNMSGLVMRKGLINAVFVGCDRVAANGDTANKIGTSVVATVARRYNVPFYVCAPTSTIDMNTPDGDHIVIEQRKPEEVTEMWYEKRMAPEGVKVFNPAFDVTDNELITAIITEKGIARAPFNKSLADICGK